MHNGDAAVAFFYVRHNDPFLRQGEIIADLLEPRLRIDELTAIDANQPAKVDPIQHLYSIIVSQDCDLKWDYEARSEEASEHKLLTHVLFCGLFPREEIKDESKRRCGEFRRISNYQNERYHYLSKAPVNGTEDILPELIADFKTAFSLPVEFVYWLVSSSQAIRKGALSSPYLEDFMHRFYSFLGRVATPAITE